MGEDGKDDGVDVVLVRVLGHRGGATGVAVSFGYGRRCRSARILTEIGGQGKASE
jgi:hypothetical protein